MAARRDGSWGVSVALVLTPQKDQGYTHQSGLSRGSLRELARTSVRTPSRNWRDELSDNMMLNIGDVTDDGGYQIADIAHPSFFGGDLNQVRVTVRELYGDDARPEDHLEAMQKLAQLAVRELNDVRFRC